MYSADGSLYIYNEQIFYNISSLPYNMSIELYGHLTSYDAKNQIGNFSVTFGLFNKTYLFTDPSSLNSVNFEFKLLRSTSVGTIITNFQNKKWNYTFSSTEY